MTQHRNPLQPVRDVKQYDPQAGGTIAARQTAGLAALTGIARAQAGQTAARRRRFISFAVIGGGVFLAGLAFQALLVRAGTGPYGSYAGQALFSIELNFLLNRSITWRDRGAPFWRSCRRFTTQRALLSIPNLLLYSAMVRLGLPWLYANVAVTAVFTVINFFFADRWSFAAAVAPAHGRHAASARGEASYRRQPVAVTPAERPGSPTKDRSERPRRGHRIADSSRIIDARGEAANRRPPGTPTGFNPADGAAYLREFTATAPAARLQSPTSRLRSSAHGEAAESPANQQRLLSVSVIVPCKDNPDTIRETVDALLSQDYPGLLEVILVGSVGDTTWRALADITDPRLQRLEQEYTPGTRDPAVKRDKGILKASGDILALADSDIVMEPGWLTAGVRLLNVQGGGVVAGGMKSIHDTFWGRFVDRNRLARKTPRLPEPYQVTAQNFGRRDRKPPITANLLFTRDVYATSPIDTSWSYGYEDYEWMWRIVQAGHPVQLTGELDGRHHHRRTFRQLAREYRRAADGCARFVKAHPSSPLARKRRWQAILLPCVAVGAAAAADAAFLSGYEIEAAAGAAAFAGAASVREFRTSRTTESLAYPLAGAALGVVFTANLAGSLLRGQAAPPTASADTEDHGTWWRRRLSWPLALVLALQAGLSLSLIWSNTAFADEALYLYSGHLEWSHWLHHTPLYGQSFNLYFSGAPQLYPLIGAAANALGGLAGARLLSLAFMLTATILLYDFTVRLFNQRAAVVAALMWVISEPAIKLGAFATYDPMAILLMCVSAWCVGRAKTSTRHAEFVFLAGLAMAVANLTAYSYAVMDPAIIALAIAVWTDGDRRRIWPAIRSALWITGVVVVIVLAVPTLLHDWSGIFSTTFARHSGGVTGVGSGWRTIARQAWDFEGLVTAVAVLGVILTFKMPSERRQLLLLTVLAAPLLIVPLEQIHVNTTISEGKHVAVGVWLAAAAAGFAVDRILNASPWPRGFWAVAAVACLLVFPVYSGYFAARAQSLFWPNTSALNTAVRRLAVADPSRGVLLENANPTEYYLSAAVPQRRWSPLYSTDTKGELGYIKSISNQDFEFVGVEITATLPGVPLARNLFGGRVATVRSDLLTISATSSATQSVSQVISYLLHDSHYRIAVIGPYNATSGSNPGAFIIWQRRS